MVQNAILENSINVHPSVDVLLNRGFRTKFAIFSLTFTFGGLWGKVHFTKTHLF